MREGIQKCIRSPGATSLEGKTEYQQLNIFSPNANNCSPLHSCETSDFYVHHIFRHKNRPQKGGSFRFYSSS